MFDPFTIALIGGAAGGLLNKKDPLKGALMGAGLGYGGAVMAPSLLGTAPGLTAAPAAASGTGLTIGGGTTGLKLGASAPGLLGATPETLGAMNGGTGVTALAGGDYSLAPGLMDKAKAGLSNASQYAKPMGEAAMAANSVKGLFGSDAQAPQPMQTQGDNGSLAQIAQADQQGLLAMQDADMKRRQQQMAMIQQMMGRG